ncbi:flagellar biosynthesis anti-sigma factor FlgM [Proteiniborus sp. DW1]|uniref:flagellar biosynthesis anti-sigma factor FlgM n=1 Tax=Proteiniborus sp. DW1 TaxID=1889883 RepID=UPI000945969A|nr:flagellar biosynthesis anti-sigma factor FlgM [Proteiniborus sp. DW1]
MKIFNSNNSNINKLIQAYRKQGINKEGTTTGKASKNDELSLSDVARDYQFALNAIKNVPDIRKEKVDAIKEQIRTGTYVVDAGNIAEKMLESINFDRKV